MKFRFLKPKPNQKRKENDEPKNSDKKEFLSLF